MSTATSFQYSMEIKWYADIFNDYSDTYYRTDDLTDHNYWKMYYWRNYRPTNLHKWHDDLEMDQQETTLNCNEFQLWPKNVHRDDDRLQA